MNARDFTQWANALDWTPFATGGVEQRAAWLAGRAFRLRHGPRPADVEWNGATPYAKALGLYSWDQDCRIEWEFGWADEHHRLTEGS